MKKLLICTLVFAAHAYAADCPTAATLLTESQTEGLSSDVRESKLREVLEKCPDLAEGHFQLGGLLLKTGRASEAKKSFERAIGLKRDALFLVALGNSCLELKDEKNAELAFEDALKADTNSTKAMQALSVLSFRQGKKPRAEELLRRAIQISPEDASLFFNLGVLLADAGRHEEAAESFRAATERKSPYPEAFIQLGSALLQSAQFEQAEKAFRSAALHEPNNLEIWIGLGASLDGKGNFPAAISNYEKALALDPNNALALINWGIATVKNGQLKEGIEKLKQVAVNRRDDFAVRSALGWALLQNKDLPGAELELEEAIKLNPHDSFALNNLGVLFQLKGDGAKAKEAFERAQEAGVLGNSVKANLNLGKE